MTIAQTTSAPLEPTDWVPARPFRAHVQHLMAATGLDARVLAQASGVPLLTMQRLASPSGRPGERIRRRDARALLRLQPRALRQAATSRVDARASIRMVRRLVRRHWSVAQIAVAAGLDRATVRDLLTGPDTCTALTDLRLRALRAQWVEQTLRHPTVVEDRRRAA